MAKMMRNRSWVKVTNTYGADYAGSFRGRDRIEAQQLVAEWADEIWEEKQIRELHDFYYGRYTKARADKLMELHGLPTPPATGCRTP